MSNTLWRAEALDTYLTCPLMYKYRWVEHRADERPRVGFIRTLTLDTLYNIMESGGELGFDALEGFLADIEVRARLMTKDVKMAERVARRVPELVTAWYTQYYVHMRHGTIGRRKARKITRGTNVMPEPHIVCRKSIVIPRVETYGTPLAHMYVKRGLGGILTSMVAKSPNVTFLLFNGLASRVSMLQKTVSEADREFARDATLSAIRGISNAYFPPINPASPICRKVVCQYFYHCKRHRFSAKST